MEFLNKVELVGVVGNIRKSEVNGGLNAMANMSVATSYAYRAQSGEIVVQTEWTNVVAWEGANIAALDSISKGDKVRVIGRLKTRKYTASDGIEKYSTEVIAKSVEKVECEGNLSLPQ